MRMRSLGWLMVFALWPAPAVAQQPADMARAKESFNAGAAAYAMGEYSAAIQALDAAYALTPLPAIAFSLAQAERKQYFVDHDRAHLDRSMALFRRYLDEVPSGGRRSDAVDALAQLEPMAVKLSSDATIAPPPKEPARSTRLIVTSDAPAAMVSVDGRAPTTSPWIGEVEPGQHRVKVTAQGFYDTEQDIVAVEGELMPAAVALREQPSTVAVWSSPEAGLYVDGSFMRQGGEGVTLQLPSGAHRLQIAQKGHVVSSHELELERGQSQALHVSLAPTRQRQTAQALLIAGGGSLVAGIVVGALAVRSEGLAQDFLDKRAQGNVSSADLAAYHSDVLARDRYRVAAAICLASSAGLVLTGLFLHELDQPRLEGPPRPSIAITPLLLPGGGGAVVSF
jgi:tetratricopeptide (TPR) repeat protein